MRDIILDLRNQGKTVFFSTHILPDAETLCDRVALVRDGRLIQVGRIDEILSIDVAHLELLVSGGEPGAMEAIRGGVQAGQRVGERWRLEIAEAALLPVLQAVSAAGARILSVQPIRQSLEDYFFKEMGSSRKEGPWELHD